MALQDKIKWDKKYQETVSLLEDREPSEKLIKIIKQVKGKKALDVASGAGRNSLYLAKNGFDVEALDISQVALDVLNKKGYKNISCKFVDLDEYKIEKSYDLIVMTNFLNREIIPKLINALKDDGVLFIETYMEDSLNEKTPSNPNFLLKKDELKTFLDDSLELLEYEEFINEDYEMYRMKKQFIAVRKLFNS